MQNTELHIIDFKTQSIVATFQDRDYWDDMREWELKNNVDILEFKVFDGTRQAIALQQQNLVLRQDREGNVIPYTIEGEVEKTASDRSITVRAVGSWTGLRKANFIRPQKLEGFTAHQYVALATAGTKWQPGNIAYASFRTMTLDEFTDPLTLLKKTATLFNLELNYRVEVDGNTITGWFVDLVEKIGRVTRKEIELGKDLINVTRIEHTKNICTALLGFARGEDNEVITIEKINNGSPYIVDNEAFQRWSENGQHKYGFYQPETEGEIDAKRLMTLMKTEMEKRKNSSVGYEVDALDIAEVFGLRHELIMKGDTIGIKDTAFTPALYLEARAIGGKESNTNPDRNKYTFGEYHEIVDYDAEMRRMYNRVQGLLENKAGKPMLDQLNKLVQEQESKMNEVIETNKRVTEITEKLNEMVTNNSVTIHDGPNAPTEGLKEGKSLWLDTSNGKPGILKIWRGGKWEDVTEDFSGLEKEIRDQVAKDVQEKTNQLNKSVSDMEKRAGEVEKKAESLETKANDLNKEIEGLKGGVQSLDQITKEIKETERGTQETLKELKVNGQKVDQTIVQIGKSLEGFNTSISQIKKDAETTSKTVAEQQQTISGFSQSIQKLETTDKTINETLVKQQQSLNGFTNEISQLKKKDGEINETLVKHQQSLNGFTNEISQLKKTDGELKEITVKQEQSIKGISNSIVEVNKNISGQSQKINTLESTVDGNKKLIQKVETDVKNMDTDVINLMRGTKELIPPTYFKGESVALSKDRFNDNAVVDILGAWHGLAYHFTTLKNEGKLNLGDTVTYSVWVRIKGAKDGERMQQSMYDGLGFGPEVESATNQWKQVSGSFKIEQKHLDSKDNVIRVEAWESSHAKGWVYQQSSPMLSVTKKAYPWRQAPEDTVSEGKFTSVTTEIKEEAGRISTKLEKVEARTVGGENWIINTGRNQRPQTIGMVGGAMLNKAGHSFHEDYMSVECTDQTDSFYQFHLDNTKMGDYEKGKDMTFSVDLQNDVHVDFLVFQFINGSWTENLQTGFPAGGWSRRSFTFQIDGRATGWGMRLRFARSEASKGKKFGFKRPKLEKGSVPTDFSKSTYELEQSVDGVTERITKTESVVNDAGDRNYVRNGDFTHYWADNDLGWDKALNGNLRSGNWSTGYNNGTTDPTKGYHMHVNDKKFGYPVVAVINKNGPIVGGKRWLGLSQGMPKSFVNDFQPGDTFTIAVDVWTETANNKLAIGFHHFITGNNTQSFYSGCPELMINPVKKWVRIHFTGKLEARTDMSKAFNLYVYGDRSNDGSECYFKNVSVLKGSMPKTFAPSPEDGVKETLFNEKVTEITKDADGIKTNVKNLTELTTKQGQQITSSETQMKQLSDELSAKMTSKQVEDYVAGVGSTNELRNASFSQNEKYWIFNKTEGATSSIDKNLTYKGNASFLFTSTGLTQNKWFGITGEFIPCQSGEDFVSSAYFITDGKPPAFDAGTGCFIEIEWWSADKKTRIATNRTRVELTNHIWRRFEITTKAPANTGFIRFRVYNERNGRFWMACPMLQRGKVASEFMENPKDITDVDYLREELAKRIATEQYNQKVTELERSIKANKDGIDLRATKTEVYTRVQADGTFAKDAHVKTLEGRIQVNEKNINLSVKENNLIASINLTKETATIQASKINLIGAITAQHFQANTIKGVKYESHNAKDATNRVEIFNSIIKSFGPLDKSRNAQNYAELKEGGLQVYEVAPNGSPYGGKHVEALPGRLNVTSDRWSSAIEPSEFRIWAPNNLATIALGEVPLATDGYGLRLTAPEGIMVQATQGSTRPTIQFNPPEAIYFDGFGNIVGGKYAKDWSTWSIKDAQGRLKYITGVGVGSSQTTEYSSYGGGHAFNHNGTRLCAMWIQGANWMQQFGTHAIFKWQNNARRFEFRTGDDGGWSNATAGSFQNASSLVWKKDISNFEGSALEIILETDIMTYRYKNIESAPFVDVEGNVIESDQEIGEAYGPVRVGVISEFAPKLIANEDGSAVDLYAMISLGWKGIQENHKDIQDKDKRLNDQETRMKDLEITMKNQSDTISTLETKLNQVLELLGKE
ncbi:phage tail spike protein [Bacillus thuringiensis]|nr:phage tail spike protein [Bacillus thuringiensis]